MLKKQNCKYYTPLHIVDLVIQRVEKIIGLNNISEFIEPAAGEGVFLDKLYKTKKKVYSYDLYPERKDIIKQNYLELDLSYKKNRCIIGNPPFGNRKNDLTKKFYNKSVQISDYICFILPIRQYNNDVGLYQFDLIYSENLGIENYSGNDIHCCFNIYKRNSKGLNKKPKYELKNVKIEEHHRTRNLLLDDFDYRFCSFGTSIGKECKNKYCKELCININDKYKKQVINILKNINFKKEFPSISSPYVAPWQIIKYIKKEMPGLI